MGTRNPDRIALSLRRRGCETVDQMRRQGWDVVCRCRDCGLLMRVDLAMIIRVRGPHLSLWNRTARCRRLGCLGHVEFQARAPGMASHEALTAPFPDR
jgi:hypothetical protein